MTLISNSHNFLRPAVRAGGDAPINTVAPSITFEGVTGYPGVISLDDGTWTGAVSFARQWQRDGVDIAGETGTSFSLTPFDVGKDIGCVVTATNGSGSTPAVSNTLIPDALHVAWVDPSSGGSGIVNSPTNPFQTAQSAYDALVSSFGETGTLTLVFLGSTSGQSLNVNIGNLTALEIWGDPSVTLPNLDTLDCGIITASTPPAQLFLFNMLIGSVAYHGDSGLQTYNGGTIIGNNNSAINNLQLTGTFAEAGGAGSDGASGMAADGDNGTDSDTSPSPGGNGQPWDASGGQGQPGGDGGNAVNITLNSVVVQVSLIGPGGDGGPAGMGGNGGTAQGGNGGAGGNYIGPVTGTSSPGANGGNGGDAISNGGQGGTGGGGGNGATVTVTNGAAVTAGTVILTAGNPGGGGGGGSAGTTIVGSGGAGGSGVDADGNPLSGDPGSAGSFTGDSGANGDPGPNGADGSIITI